MCACSCTFTHSVQRVSLATLCSTKARHSHQTTIQDRRALYTLLMLRQHQCNYWAQGISYAVKKRGKRGAGTDLRELENRVSDLHGEAYACITPSGGA
jgi:hypothetical protein